MPTSCWWRAKQPTLLFHSSKDKAVIHTHKQWFGGRSYFELLYFSRISPWYPWKIPRKFHQQFMKESLSLWGFREVWGIFPGAHVDKIMELLSFKSRYMIRIAAKGSGHSSWETPMYWPQHVDSATCPPWKKTRRVEAKKTHEGAAKKSYSASIYSLW